MTDASGSVLWDGVITTPFGQSLATMGALTQNLMFPGQYRDAETGYDDNWHRTYDPTLGRYLQSDPIGLAGGLNRYAYVGGNPVSAVDPTGESEILDILISPIGDTWKRRHPKMYEMHINRNLLNVGRGVVCNESEVDLNKYKKLPVKQNMLHMFPTSLRWFDRQNVKYVEIDGGRREMIFDGNGKLVTAQVNAPSYNYIGPDDAWGHTVVDVIPWVVWGNGINTPLSCECSSSGSGPLTLRGAYQF